MFSRFKAAVTLTLIASTLLSVIGLAGPVSAQSGDYVKTFDLPTKPTTDGAYAGVDPSGATVTYWHNQPGNDQKTLEGLIAAFNQGNPWKITVKPVLKGNNSAVFQAMLAGLQTKDLPNLVSAYQNEAAEYQNVNALVDLNDFFNDKTYGLGQAATNDFFQSYLQSDVNPQFKNQRLGFPLFRSMEVLYYNADALQALGFSAAPKNWNDFETMACKYKDSASGRIGYEVSTDASFIAAAAFAQGGDVYDPKANKFTYDSPEAQVAPAIMQDMMQKGCASLPAAAFADQNDFAAQKSVFYVGTSAGFPFVKAAIQQAGKAFNWDIAPIPYKTQPVQNVFGASVSVPATTKPQQLAAWLFIRWMDEAEQQAVWAKATNYYPVRQSTAAQMTDYFTANPQYKHGFDLLGNTKVEPPIVAYNPVRTLVTNAFNDVLDGKPVADTFGKLNDDANAAITQNQPGAPLPTPLPTATPKPATPAATAAK